jgi:GAF domain-containing protein
MSKATSRPDSGHPWLTGSTNGGLVSLDTETARQDSVTRYGLSGPEAWRVPDARIVTLARQAHAILGTDFCGINILDGRRQWTVSGKPGVPVSLSPRSISVCQRMLARVETDAVIVLADASADAELADNPWVNGDAGSIRFYAAMPLIGREGYALGTICAWSVEPGQLSKDQQAGLRVVRDAVMRQLDRRRDAVENELDEPVG